MIRLAAVCGQLSEKAAEPEEEKTGIGDKSRRSLTQKSHPVKVALWEAGEPSSGFLFPKRVAVFTGIRRQADSSCRRTEDNVDSVGEGRETQAGVTEPQGQALTPRTELAGGTCSMSPASETA